ncbi:MAG: HypC/HybG/HupF family hydrogenase formation chaperone [Rhizobiales bacterium]|nr:HypC/HybG/HupF family hydrogenase formation chaperone [Hyphomicrobiales bacterium]MBO6698209.1 HypC/HybG/HupF family hydrogenase formation chaperone [Hyphomicrobiales bacterium]MBO6735537.1 HypC/HybG/HupF family hydrogenase formation chaperone [Hyphomicrobiales bacterium]MBO6910655.1 HypC/HybG/HupF family hydrogenase formation chaperone [Hyphomicrobiales bacterium]MBO6956064.1 HypC/HybG/HupF family hydrogenase formation chaperone [Hyphomicrobiales bacterium]
MCVGVPMRVLAHQTEALMAPCVTREGTVRSIDLALVGPQGEGAWVLTHQGAAREVIDATIADAIADALQAVELAMRGGPVDAASIDDLFPDLAGREPELPPHLRAQLNATDPSSGDAS